MGPKAIASVRKRVLRAVVTVILTLIFLYVLIHALFIYLGGYWENMAVLNRLSGPKRFKQFVVDPIPSNIHNLKGGYSGFPQGIIRTYFTYSGDFSNMKFLAEWEKMEGNPFRGEFDWYIKDTDATMVYRKKRYESYTYLLIDEENKRGILYLP
jgi:hypothetical protein